jgi:hypothetical protein
MGSYIPIGGCAQADLLDLSINAGNRTQVQRRSTRYVLNRYHNTSSVTDMINHLEWVSLEDRRKASRLGMMLKPLNDLVRVDTTKKLIPVIRDSRNCGIQEMQILETFITCYIRLCEYHQAELTSGRNHFILEQSETGMFSRTQQCYSPESWCLQGSDTTCVEQWACPLLTLYMWKFHTFTFKNVHTQVAK